MVRVKRLARPAETEAVNPEPGARKRGRSAVDAVVGQRLREARLLAGLSQNQLGAHVGVTFQAVQKYESGENRLSASRLLSVAEFLRRPVSFFFNDLSADGPMGDAAGLTPKEIKLLRYFRGIDKEAIRDWMLKLAKCLGEGDGLGQGKGKPL
jgi:transcriptional regulator with XRE-family HTH domain